MAPLFSGARRDPEMARIAIDAHLAAPSLSPPPDLYLRMEAAARSLQLAILINDQSRVEATLLRAALDEAEQFVAAMPSDKAALLFLRSGRAEQPDPTKLDAYKRARATAARSLALQPRRHRRHARPLAEAANVRSIAGLLERSTRSRIASCHAGTWSQATPGVRCRPLRTRSNGSTTSTASGFSNPPATCRRPRLKSATMPAREEPAIVA